MKYIDITQTITDRMKVYSTDPSVKIKPFKSLKKGNSCNLLELNFGSHTGTHIDAPSHILNRAETLDDIKIEDLFCKVVVVDTQAFFKKDFFRHIKPKRVTGLLLRSGKAQARLTVDAAKSLVDNKMRLVGTDQLSIEKSLDKYHPVHRVLLGNNIIILEDLNLKKVKSGFYNLICLPLKIKQADGAPARVVLTQ